MFVKKRVFHNSHQQIRNAFSQIKKENENVNAWISHLHQKNVEHETSINKINEKIGQHEEKLEAAITHSVDTKNLWRRLESLGNSINMLHAAHHRHTEKVDLLSKLSRTPEKPPSSNLKEKIVKTFSRKSKRYLKNTILNYVEQHQEISALQLKDIIVDQQGLTSKSSFYRILAEIESEEEITMIKEGKNKIFVSKKVAT